MSTNHAMFEFAVTSEAYQLVAASIAANPLEKGKIGAQFLLLNEFPSEDEDARMQPVLVSDWLKVPQKSSAT